MGAVPAAVPARPGGARGNDRAWGGVLRVILLYLVFGSLWIAVSDRVLEALVADPHRISVLQTWKGWAFVLVSAALIALTVRRELRLRARAEERLRVSEERYHTLFEGANDAIVVFEPQSGRIVEANRRAGDLVGRTAADLAGQPVSLLHPPEEADRCELLFAEAGRTPGGITREACVYHREARRIPVEVSLTAVTLGGRPLVLGIFRDVTKRVRAEEQARVRLEHLEALHSIDLVIGATLDLGVTLREFVDHVRAQMRVDAVSVLLVQPRTQSLDCAAAQGFRSEAIRGTHLRLGEGIAGVAALERRPIAIPDLRDPASGFVRTRLLEGEGFLAYYAEPLAAKGKVVGVLEIFHRAPLGLDEEQLQFLRALAAQAALAIDNAELFEQLRRSNIDLALAYDATLEGWARALDLRNRATERHTERVTELTLRLARAFGVGEDELVQVRRGALLHDIGKIGVPDSILLKPGPLTGEEREVMKRHPEHALEMLRPIAYLRPALDIPYGHHEHWDGTGYPRGLRGEQIPLAARIFAVADVYDALRAPDRPYRRPMSEEQARAELRSLAGTHLDPKVVEAFLDLGPEPAGPVPVMAGSGGGI